MLRTQCWRTGRKSNNKTTLKKSCPKQKDSKSYRNRMRQQLKVVKANGSSQKHLLSFKSLMTTICRQRRTKRLSDIRQFMGVIGHNHLIYGINQ